MASNPFIESTIQKFKIFYGYFQIVSQFNISFDIPWPEQILELFSWFSLVQINIFNLDLQSLRCSLKFDFFKSFLFYNLAFPIFALTVGLAYLVAYIVGKLTKKSTYFGKIWRRAINISMLVIFLFYPSISSSILQMYKCRKNRRYLFFRKDYTIACFQGEWLFYSYLGYAGIILYYWYSIFSNFKIYQNRKIYILKKYKKNTAFYIWVMSQNIGGLNL